MGKKEIIRTLRKAYTELEKIGLHADRSHHLLEIIHTSCEMLQSRGMYPYEIEEALKTRKNQYTLPVVLSQAELLFA